jgi:peptidoglycan/xylan/chitin deacetylase (PgdA/CDA1 family)
VPAGCFLVSLDFELFWGMRDKTSIESYRANLLGVREAIPSMLALFRRYQVRATWAAVGLLLFDSRRELLRYLPERRPAYSRRELNPYLHLAQIGDNERSDPYHYGLSLAQRILEQEGMELASHTFSHYYCLEAGQTQEDFRADLEAAVAASSRLGVRPVSLVFPRNQCRADYLATCAELGFTSFRGNPPHWMYRAATDGEQRSKLRRLGQLLDAYFNLSGDLAFAPSPLRGLWNLPASRFLSPYRPERKRLEWLRLRRICEAMTAAAQSGRCFHLWWHPHNFGVHLTENLNMLAEILKHYLVLRDRYGMESRTLREAAL